MSGIFTAARPLSVSSPAIPLVGGEPALVPLKLQGVEAINSLFEYTLTLQTPDALKYMGRSGSNFDLKTFIGRELTCSIELEGHGQFVPGVAGGSAANQGAGVREISGIITGAKLLGEDDRHALYELTLRPWLHLATLTTDCKVFQDMTPVEIIESVLSDYAFVAEKRLIERYPVRDYTVQYNETDFEFVSRLMQEWGISYHFSHGGGIHRLIWSDHNGAFQVTQEDHDKGVSAYHQIPFYPLGHKTDREYIHGFSLTHRLTSGSYATRDYDYTRPRATLDVREAAPRNTGHADAEVYVWRGDKTHGIANLASGLGNTGGGVGGSDYSQPNRGADKAANQTESQGSHLARLRMQALRQRGQRASGVGHVRGIVPGCTFALTEYPQEKANTEYIVLGTRLVIENVGEDAQRLVSGLTAVVSGSTGSNTARGVGLMRGTAKSANTPGGAAALAGNAAGFIASGATAGFAGAVGGDAATVVALSDAERLTGQWRVHVAFDVQPTTEALRPAVTQPKPKTGGPETALVVGPGAGTAESNIYTDTLGRIKVQFHWDRYGGKNQNSSCWVRVAHPWAGNQLGAMHIPRIGQEVLVDFLGGDPDMPLVQNSVHNAANMAPWSLPDQQALSGFRSRELTPGGGNSAAGRSNHLILDDTEQKIQAQLKSDHQHSSLSLGHITRIEDNLGRKDPRGEGFELRTDGHGVVRAKDGLLISTEGRPKAQAHAKDMGETTQRLNQAQDQHAQLGDLAMQMQVQDPSDQGDVAKAIKDQNDGIEGKGNTTKQDSNSNNTKFPELSDPHLVLSSPAGIASTTSGSTHQHSDKHHAITSAQHTSISAAKSVLVTARKAVRIYLRKLGVRMVAWGGDIEIAAVEQGVHFLANVNITETTDTIEFHAKKQLELGGGSSYSVLNKDKIEHNTAGEFVVHSSATHMDGPKTENTSMHMPIAKEEFNEMFVLKNTQGKPVPHFPYAIRTADGRVLRGMTNAKGEAMRLGSGSTSRNLTIEPDAAS